MTRKLPVKKFSPLPAHAQVRRMILERIKAGEWGSGGAIPSEHKLCDMCGVSRITVRRAVGDLVKEGMLYTVPGKGAFVSREVGETNVEYITSFFSSAKKRGVKPEIRVLEEGVIKADADLAARLGLRRGAKLIHVFRVKIADGVPIMTEERYIPEKVCPGFVEKGYAAEALTRVFRDVYKIELEQREVFVHPFVIDEKYSPILSAPVGQCGLLANEILSDKNGRIVKWEQRIQKHSIHFKSRAVLTD